MTCERCEEVQAAWQGTTYNLPPEIYVRVGAANVQILACQDHARMLIDRLRVGEDVISKLREGQ